jgi:hypothetical protein
MADEDLIRVEPKVRELTSKESEQNRKTTQGLHY